MKAPILFALLAVSFNLYAASLSFPRSVTRWSNDIRYASRITGVPRILIASVMEVESGGNPRAVSRAGAFGLMQVMPQTAKLLGIKHWRLPRENILAGTIYLGMLLKHYDGNLQLAVAAYNEGPGALDTNGEIIEYVETRQYVKKVFRVMNGD